MTKSRRQTDISPYAYFQSVCSAYQNAIIATDGEMSKDYRIADLSIRLCFAGPALIPHITPALGHLSLQLESTPELKVYLWDSVTTGVVIPDIPFETGSQYVPGEIWSYYDNNLMILFQPAHDTINMLDLKNNRAVYWVRDASKVPYHDHGSPLRMIMHRWMRERGRLQVHSAAVGLPQGGVLLTGKGGSGKSTTALACLNSPLLYAGDDYCLISNTPGPHVYSLYSTGKQNAADIKRFPELQQAISNAGSLDNEKVLFFFHNLFPEKLTSGFPVVAIMIPQITGGSSTRIKRVSPAKGLLALAPSTVYQLHAEEQQQTIKILGKFVQQVPNYIMELGTDLKKIPGVILDFLSENIS